MDGLSLAIVSLIVLCLFLIRHLRGSNSGKRLPPGPRGLPLLGSLLALRPREHLTLTRWRQEYGDILIFRSGTQPFLLLNSYNALKEAFLGQGDAFAGRPDVKYLRNVAHNSGIVFIDGPVWKEHRRFVLHVLRDFGFGRTVSEDIIRSESDALIQRLDAKVGQPIPTFREYFAITINNVIARLTFGERSGAEDPQFPELLRHIDSITNRITFASLLPVIFPSIMKVPSLLRFVESLSPFRPAVDFIHEFIGKKIRERIDQLGPDVDDMDLSQAKDVCDALLIEKARLEREQPGQHSFTDWQVLRDLAELFLAGTDTTATTLVWAMFFMSAYPDVQRQLQAELDSVIGRSRRPCMKDRPNLPFACAVIDEVLRCSSIARSGLPHRTLEDTELMGYFIPKNMLVIANLYGIHHDPELWQRPDDFWPGHFLDDSGQYKSSPYLNAFSMGKRACLGETLARMETFLFFTALMQTYDVRLADPKADVNAIAYGTAGNIRRPLSHEIILTRRADE